MNKRSDGPIELKAALKRPINGEVAPIGKPITLKFVISGTISHRTSVRLDAPSLTALLLVLAVILPQQTVGPVLI